MLKYLKLGLVSIIFVMTFLTLSAKGPELHNDYLRHNVGNKTVMIRGLLSGGTGFFVKAKSGDTYILTNNHVCEAAVEGVLFVKTPDNLIHIRKVVANYQNHDLCLIESVKGYTGLSVADKSRVGDMVTVVGHPKLQPLTLTKGEFIGNTMIQLVTKINTTKEECPGQLMPVPPSPFQPSPVYNICIVSQPASQITAYSRGGSSGSPVVNFFGNVVGVLFAGNIQDQFQSFIVPLKEVQQFLSDY